MATAKEQALNGIVVGMKGLTGDDTPKPRVDIDVLLYNNPDCFNLFLQAMTSLQTKPDLNQQIGPGKFNPKYIRYYELAGTSNAEDILASLGKMSRS